MIEIKQGDCIEVMRGMAAESVQCCVTSPPYYGLRDYGVEGQIGLEETPEAFVDKMVEVFREVRRVLRDDGTVWLNLGDSYAGNCSRTSTGRAGMGKEREGIYTKGGPGLKPKDLLGIPWRVALALQEPDYKCLRCLAVRRFSKWPKWDNGAFAICPKCCKRCGDKQPVKVADGWYLRQDIIWHKPNPMPESVRDRCTKSHEYIFLMSKKARYFYDADAIAELSNDPTDNRKERTKLYHKRHPTDKIQGMRAGSATYETRNKRSVWTMNTHSFKECHFAVFPPELPETCIKAGTSESGCCPECGAPWKRITEKVVTKVRPPEEGTQASMARSGMVQQGGNNTGTHSLRDGFREGFNETIGWQPTCKCDAGEPVPCTVLDPFCGAGTTGLIAMRYQRSFVGIELSPDYCDMARKRINDDQPLFNEVM